MTKPDPPYARNCAKCGDPYIVKSKSGFARSYCDSCRNRYMSEYRQRPEANEKLRAYNYRPDVLAKHRAAQKAHRYAMKDRIRAIAQERGCAECGTHTPPFHWHHVDPTEKQYNLATMSSMSWVRIEAELAKCVPLCKPDHERHHNGHYRTRVSLEASVSSVASCDLERRG